VVGRKAALTTNKTRGFVYLLAKLLSDLQAVRTGRVDKCIARYALRRATGRGWGGSRADVGLGHRITVRGGRPR
jgi:hypothetical protein